MWASFTKFELRMTMAEAEACTHMGDCEPDVRALWRKPHIRRQLAKIDPDKLRKELEGYGAWSDNELDDKDWNEIRILWIAAANIVEEHWQKKGRR